jgi:hypothetical protein
LAFIVLKKGPEEMLTTSHKAEILQRAGYPVPLEPEHPVPPDPMSARTHLHWQQEVETLFVEYAAARAAKSLRDSEEQRQLRRLRRMADHSTPAQSH